MEVYLEENNTIDVELGDVFFESNEGQYFIFSKLGKNSYGLVSSTFDEIYDDEVFGSFEHAKKSLESYVKEQQLRYYPECDYHISLNIKSKKQ